MYISRDYRDFVKYNFDHALQYVVNSDVNTTLAKRI